MSSTGRGDDTESQLRACARHTHWTSDASTLVQPPRSLRYEYRRQMADFKCDPAHEQVSRSTRGEFDCPAPHGRIQPSWSYGLVTAQDPTTKAWPAAVARTNSVAP